MTTVTVPVPASSVPYTIQVADAEATLVAAGYTVIAPGGSTSGPAKTTVGEITDIAGNQWSINTAGQITVIPAGKTAAVVDTMTANVVALAYFEPAVFQLNKSGNWYKTSVYPAQWSLITSPFSSTTTIATTA